MKKALVLSFFIGAFFISNVFAFDIPYKASGFVNDFANVLSSDKKEELEQELSNFRASTTNEIVVVIIPNMSGRYIEEYATQMFREWGVGSKQNNNGVLLLISLEERKDRIEVGYGLEGALTDLQSDQILKTVNTYLKEGDYDSAVLVGASSIMSAVQGEYKAEDNSAPTSFLSSLSPDVFMGAIFFFFFFVIPWTAAVLGRTKSWWLGGVVGFVLAALLFVFLVKTLFVFLLTLIGLLFDYVVSKNYGKAKSSGSDPSWWAGGRHMGGGFGGFNSSSGGFGGFGGGSSGGGGSSSSW